MAFSSTIEATSTAGATSCYVEPMDIGDISMIVDAAISGLPLGEEYRNIVVPDSSFIPEPAPGSAVDNETMGRLNEVFGQYTVCLYTQDWLRLYSLFTSDGIARDLASGGRPHTHELARLYAPPLPVEALIEVPYETFARAELLPDGRIAAYLQTILNCRNAEMTPISCGERYMIFRNVEGHWLIDQTYTNPG